MLTDLLTQASDALVSAWALIAQAPTPESPPPSGINTDGIVNFFGMKIAPILVALIGVVILGRANRGQVSQTLTSAGIAGVGALMIAGSTAWFAVGAGLLDVVFQ